MKRQRRVQMTGQLVAALIANGTPRTEPLERFSELRVVDIAYDAMLDIATVTVESPAFDFVADGDTPPLWTPTFMRVEEVA